MIAPLAFLVASAAPPRGVPVDKFQTWMASKRTPLDFHSAGVRIRVVAQPCPARPVGDTSCHWYGFNNQANVTVSAPGLRRVTISTDRQSSYARVAIVKFDKRDARPGVIIESQSGGSAGDMSAQLLIPAKEGYRVLMLGKPGALDLQGEIADFPRDKSGDGRIDLELEDGRFAYVFGCGACTPRPPRVFTVKDGKIVDESPDPNLRSVFIADMARLAPICFSRQRYRNGACAAYVADAARAGQFSSAWTKMVKHYERKGDLWQGCKLSIAELQSRPCPQQYVIRYQTFPESLRAFLTQTKYL